MDSRFRAGFFETLTVEAAQALHHREARAAASTWALDGERLGIALDESTARRTSTLGGLYWRERAFAGRYRARLAAPYDSWRVPPFLTHPVFNRHTRTEMLRNAPLEDKDVANRPLDD